MTMTRMGQTRCVRSFGTLTHCPFSSRLAHGARQTSQAGLTCKGSGTAGWRLPNFTSLAVVGRRVLPAHPKPAASPTRSAWGANRTLGMQRLLRFYGQWPLGSSQGLAQSHAWSKGGCISLAFLATESCPSKAQVLLLLISFLIMQVGRR